ncbi:YIEGIA family protein [Anaerobacillus sp. MEB173]|uniref:YIEGIA family protein n=1 Tax=Anaerobacillus sp. MEB173 TaxID=3383345 RepID=UPI003F915FD3
MDEYTYPIIFGIVVGFISRIDMLKTDYRQYPTYPHGRVIHLALGFLAAALGTIAVPSIMEREFTAVTFLTIAASQFRDVRNMERNTLEKLDEQELVPRGKTYIEGIAMAFEGRNYLVIFTSLTTTIAYVVFNFWAAVVVGIITILISKKFMSGKKLKEIADIRAGELRFDGPNLYVEDIHIMNIGLENKQKDIMKYGMGFIVEPKNFNVRATLANVGQRQAILHDMSVSLGVFKDDGTPSLVPLVRRDLDDGRIGVFTLPQVRDTEKAIAVIGEVPVLENAIRIPSESKANQKGRELK